MKRNQRLESQAAHGSRIRLRVGLKVFLIACVLVSIALASLVSTCTTLVRQHGIAADLRDKGADVKLSRGRIIGVSFESRRSLVDDSTVAMIAQLHDLEWLHLSFTNVTDRHVRQLNHLDRLRSVSVEFTSVTMDGLKLLAALPSIETLSVDVKQLPKRSREEFGRSYPELCIVRLRIQDGLLVVAEEEED